MNVETIHKLGKDLVDENKKFKITQFFQNAINSLQNMINQPQHGPHQTELTNNLKELYNGLSKSLVNELSPAWYQILVDLEIDDIFGLNLSATVKKVLATNSITPASAKEELDKLFAKHNKIITALTSITTGLAALNIGYDELKNDECEIGILIPRLYLNNDFENLGSEIKELTFILNNYSELITGEKIPFTIRTLSTTDPFITVGTVTAIAAGIAKTIGFIIDNYKKLLEIKKLKNELKLQGLPDESLQGIQDYSNDFMSKEIEILITKLIAEYNAITDSHRKKEVVNGFRISLNKIANRIDKGFNFEVRVNQKVKETTENEKEDEEILLVQEILSASKTLEFLKAEGDPILSLPESKKDEK